MAVSDAAVRSIDTEIIDSSRQRIIPVLIYLPESRAARPVILFSHGLGGSRFAATYLGKHWADRGYVVVFMQHAGSDESILVGVPPSQILSVMNQAANADFGSPEAAFGDVTLPWMLMTGTLDSAIVGNTTPADRIAVFPALAPGGKYELVLFEGEHHAFTDNSNATQSPRNPAHHPMIMALTTAFWDTWLLDYESARRWLEGDEARAILQPGDSWQFK